MSYPYVFFQTVSDAAKEDIVEFIPQLARVLPPGYATSIVHSFDRGILVYWKKDKNNDGGFSNINPGLLKNSGGYIFCCGYAGKGVLEPSAQESNIFSLLDLKNGSLIIKSSPGGIGSYVYIPSNCSQVFSWSTQPPSVGLFVGKNRDGYSVIGNRPLLVYCASALTLGIRHNRNYFHKYLCAGFAVDGDTPFLNTIACPPNKSVVQENGKYKFVAYPLSQLEPIPQDMPLAEKSKLLAEELLSACYPIRESLNSYIFLSGGKDSRSICAALSGLGCKKLSAFTYDRLDGGESAVASKVAECIEVEYEIRKTRVISDAFRALAYSLQTTDGLGMAFSHQYNFKNDLAHCQNSPVFHGNGHLLRGGSARSMNGQKSFLNEQFWNIFISSFTSNECNIETIKALGRWRGSRSGDFRDGRDILFYAHQDFRVGQFAVPATLDLTSKAFMIYPLIDEKVARFAERLSVFDRVSERVLFGAIRLLNDNLSRIPLYGEIWRFDRSPKKTDFPDSSHNFQDGYALRQPSEKTKQYFFDPEKQNRSFKYDFDYDSSYNSRIQISEIILSSSFVDVLPDVVNQEILKEISYRAEGKINSDFFANGDFKHQFMIDSFIVRLAIACSMYDMYWH
ncbi:MAG: hypothetical protein F6K23_00230 [Okeania sp. SIO2C9]|uniref:hypothetical protein n=1 Tax=Okeania sp. SIO2C9 TaxID=2607791 RepID=UPI0013C24DB6|nr:hypothetical protein [Okeania sp. SIO2C9]NEQ71638.1 hypothetical protein [Okeania sp. SIO2C9]